MKRWDWTWEEPRSTALRRKPDPDAASGAVNGASPPPSPGPPEPSLTASHRRRRTGAALALVAILVLLIAALARNGSGHTHRSAGASKSAAQAAPRLTTAEVDALADKTQAKAIDRVLSSTPAITQGGPSGNEVALTFDDGPGPYTERIVGVLNRYHVRATFFAIGLEERYFSAGTLLELRSGDAIGDHTETHPMMASLSAHDQHEQLFEQIARIELLGGPRPRLFRPPYGSFNATTYKLLNRMHLLMVLWSADTQDYTLPGVQVIVQRALEGARPGAIILMHDGGGDRSQTIAALPAIITGLRKRGLKAVTVPRLMLDDPPAPGQPIPKSLAGD